MADIQQMAPVMSNADREVARTLRREKVSRVVRYVVLIFVGLLMLYPLAWMFSASFKPNHEIFTTLGLWPAHATWDGFINGWKTGTEYHFGHYMLNTFKYDGPGLDSRGAVPAAVRFASFIAIFMLYERGFYHAR